MKRSIYHLIANHAAALARLEDAPESINKDGTHNDEFSAASDAEERALLAVLEHQPLSPVEWSWKAGYLLLHIRHTDTFDREQVEALLKSLIDIRMRSAA